MALRAFIDFDGTIARNDVGNAFFVRFGGEQCREHVRAYRNQEITAHECYRREAEAIGVLDVAAAETFLATQPIDPTFHQFVTLCGDQAISLSVVSDGLDFYVERILEANELGHLIRRTNLLRQRPDGTVTVESPYSDAECAVCACCKRNYMLTSTPENDTIIYVGDGYSDQCPVRYADIVFAKGALQTYCQKENISYFVYESFADVTSRMKELIGHGAIRHAKSAALRRRAAFEAEA